MAIMGINYPWLNYGWDFGDPPPGWTGGQDIAAFRASQRETIALDFERLSAAGMEVVRWFVLADGLSFRDERSVGRIVEDFKQVLALCAPAGVKLLPSLIDFHWCLPAVAAADGWTKGGRADMLRGAAFLDAVLDPLLEVSSAHADSIYAWEPINEPEWCERKDDMREFIRESVERINRRGFLSTVGFAHWKTIDDWHAEDLGIRLQQFHYYAQDGAPLPQASSVTLQPCLLGEFASAPAKAWPGQERQTLDARLRSASAAGYNGALSWSMRATDDATLWNAEQEALVASRLDRDRGPGLG